VSVNEVAGRSGQVARTAIIRAGALGDVLLGGPALIALRAHFPACSIHLVAPMPQAGLLQVSGVADAVSDVGDPAFVPLFDDERPAAQLPEALRGLEVAVVWLRRPEPARAQLERHAARRVIAAVPYPLGQRLHVTDWLLASLVPLGIGSAGEWERTPWLRVRQEARRWATAWARSRLGASPYVVMHPGSGSRRKNWPAREWIAVLDRLLVTDDLRLVVTAGPADTEAVAELMRAAADRPVLRQRVSTLPEASLEQLAAVIAQSALYLGNDSGVSHLAAAVGTPTLAVFGPTDPAIWRPRGRRVRVLGGTVPEPSADGSHPVIGEQAQWPGSDEVAAAAEGLRSAGGT
jgi:ADP-heptose:LPS heptosyltransferase